MSNTAGFSLHRYEFQLQLHNRYGEKEKQIQYNQNTVKCITDENKTFQTCIFGCCKLLRPVTCIKDSEDIKNLIKGSFFSPNLNYISVV